MQVTDAAALPAPIRTEPPTATKTERRLGGISPRLIGLFTLMLASEAPVIAVRALLIEAARLIASIVLGISIPLPAGWIALASFAYAALALIIPAGDGWLFRQACHGRRPQQHDWETFYEAVMELQVKEGDRRLRLPADWFIVTDPTPAAALYGETLMLTSGLMESETLSAALAHQLAHIEAGDGRLTAAIARLTLTTPRPPGQDGEHERPGPVRRHGIARPAQLILKYARGGYGIRLLHHLWESTTVAAEHHADTRVAHRGQRGLLIAALTEGNAACTGPSIHPRLRHPQPPDAHARIDRIRAGGARE